ncbi:MAG TPA: choice-of-anchor Q domain-containing protein [Pyrinomonadaceae bacterium]|nr:choice-of-anchor Q domain-containing protein [Pyrinomonadaceae bacterium]
MMIVSRCLSLVLFVVIFSAVANSATFVVNKVADTNDGTCDSDCSLREAIATATAAAGDDIIVFSSLFGVSQTIVLGGSELVLGANGSTTINGPGASLLTINGNNASRILSTGANVVATVSGITFTNGNGTGALNTGRGGAIYNVGGTLTITDCVVTANVASNGGGLNNAASTGPSVAGTLTIRNSVVSNNTTPGSGGGMQNFSTSTVTIDRSTFVGNTATGNVGGGGAQLNGGATITNSTFANNVSPVGPGGAISSNGTLGLIITNSTFSGNSAANTGGIFRGSTSPTFWIRNSIIANNTGGPSPDVSNPAAGLISEGNNIIGIVGTSTGWIMSDQQNVNPMLGALGNNGGPTQTFMPQAGSPAINMGNNCVLTATCATNNPPFSVTADQRGTARPQGGSVDVGSVEVAAPSVTLFTGRVVSSGGRQIRGATVTLSTPGFVENGIPVLVQTTRSNAFGEFSFSGVPSGQSYVISASVKQFAFTPQTVMASGDTVNVLLTGTSSLFDFEQPK